MDHAIAFGSWRWGGATGERLGLWIVMAGQRLPTAILLVVVAAVLSRRVRSWRPLAIAVCGLGALNAVVGAIKLLLARTVPVEGHDALFAKGTAFPSGHASNAVLTWGLMVALIAAYSPAMGASARRALAATAGGISLVVGVTSIYLATHWVTDIVAGWIIGGLLLWVVSRALPLERVTETAGREQVLGLLTVDRDRRAHQHEVDRGGLPARQHASRVA